MQLGSFGVAHPIYNRRFNVGAKETSTLISIIGYNIKINLPAGLTDLGRFFGPYDLFTSKQFAGKLNKILIGPSTHTANPGGVDLLNVTSVPSVNTAETNKTPVNLYSVGDPVTIVGIGRPDGWVSGGAFSGGSIVAMDNYAGVYGFDTIMHLGSATDYAYLPIKNLMARTYYTLRVTYQTQGEFDTSGGICKLSVFNGSGEIAASVIDFTISDGAWSELSSVFQSGDDETAISKIVLTSVGSLVDRLKIASISLSHASYNSTDYSTNGVSTLALWPILNSVKVDRVSEDQALVFDSSGSRFLNTAVNLNIFPVTKYNVTYSLIDVTAAQWAYFSGLLAWQELGYLINHYPGLIGVPPCLTGRIKTNLSRQFKITDTDKVSFQLVFEEAV